MYKSEIEWNSNLERLKSIIKKQEYFDEAISLVLDLHSSVHSSNVSGKKTPTLADEIFNGVSEECFRTEIVNKRTFAYNIWHITRIEDICTNILIADSEQVFTKGSWQKKINSTIIDTGNALTKEEILDFSSTVNRDELLNYRTAVGTRTREIINNLKPEDMNLRMKSERLKRILDEGALSQKEKAIWLIDFWGKKTVSGLLLMPVTKHHAMHLDYCIRIKEKNAKK